MERAAAGAEATNIGAVPGALRAGPSHASEGLELRL
jgi:hypothetical protein